MSFSGTRAHRLSGTGAPSASFFRRTTSGNRERTRSLSEETATKSTLFGWLGLGFGQSDGTASTAAPEPAEPTLHGSVTDCARQHPDRIAIVSPEHGVQLTFRQLEVQANALARRLIHAHGVRPNADAPVGVCTRTGHHAVVAMLAVMKTGNPYVPLDPAYPLARLQFMATDSNVDVVLTTGTDQSADVIRAATGATLVLLDAPDPSPADASEVALPPVPSEAYAYVLYTSGSTGRPKGVCGSHRAMLNRFRWGWKEFPFETDEVVAHKTSLNFVDSIFELFGALGAGVRVACVPSSAKTDPELLVQFLKRERVTRVVVVPSLLRAVLAVAPHLGDTLPRCNMWTTSGEALSVELAHRFFQAVPNGTLLNLYGSTEVAADVTCHALRGAGDVPGDATGIVPVGRPIFNTAVYVLDPDTLEKVAVGETGELFVAGANVAEGYWNRPDQTASAFLNPPTIQGGNVRCFRTGDFGYQSVQGGPIHFVGRRDQQVKVRGHRVECMEVEAWLGQAPHVSKAAVVPTTTRGSLQLYAYIVATPAADPAMACANAWMQWCHAELPVYMVPSKVVQLVRMPLLPNGKLNRRALTEGVADTLKIAACVDTGTMPPLTPFEQYVASVWAIVLDLPVTRIAPNDTFFLLGGNSLGLVQLAAAFRRDLEVNSAALRIHQLVDALQLADMARVLAGVKDAAPAHQLLDGRNAYPVDKMNAQRSCPMSMSQKGMYFQTTASTTSQTVYLEQILFSLAGDVDLGKLQRAFQRLVDTNDMLRTHFDGANLQQWIEPTGAVRMPNIVRSSETLKAVLVDDRAQGMELTTAPLLRARLVEGTDNVTTLVITVHHLIFDGWTLGLWLDDLCTFYDDPEAAVKEAAVFDAYATWEENHLKSQCGAYWDSIRFDNDAILEPSAAIDADTAVTCTVEVSESVMKGVREMSTITGLTPSAIFQTAWVLASTYPSAIRVTYGVMSSGRSAPLPGIAGVRGPLVRMLPVFFGFDTSGTFLSAAKGLQGQLVQTMEHEHDAPFVGLKDMPAVFDFEPEVPFRETSSFRMEQSAIVDRIGYPLSVRVSYGVTRTSILATSEVRAYSHEYLASLLAATVTNLEVVCAKNGALYLNHGSIQRRVFEPARPIAPPTDVSALPRQLIDPLLREGQRALEASAIIDVDSDGVERNVSYRELANATWHVAKALRSAVHGHVLPRVVAVIMHKGWEQVVAVIGCLRAQATYLPIDASWPHQRIQQILHVAGAVAVVSTRTTLEHVCTALPAVAVDAQYLKMSSEEDIWSNDVVQDGIVHGPRDLAYLIYTSGSTGRPKGVCCHHQGAINTNVDLIERFGIGAADRVLGLSSQSFDLSVFDVFGMLGAGGTLVLASERDATTNEPVKVGPDPQRWVEMVQAHEVSIWNTVPAFMELIVNYCEQEHRPLPASLRVVMMSGDWISPTLPSRIHAMSPRSDGIRVISLGGATEAAIWSNMFEVEKGWSPSEHGWSCIPYGRPLRNQTMYVLNDETMEHCEPWVTGVIYIGGAGVALGYFNDPVKTARQFVVHPRTGEYLFRTGDLGRLRPEGELEILGREDSQVKVNGYRIELGELEKVAMEDSRVQNCCAVVSEVQASPQLVIFYTCVPKEDGESPADDIVGQWEEVYDTVYGAAETEEKFAGWTNSYTGDRIPDAEMEEWLATTVARIRSLRPTRVLEIGFGTGMMLEGLVTSVASYHAMDISTAAVKRMSDRLATMNVTARVELAQGSGMDARTLFPNAGNCFDTIVINSVVQYFPSAQYLEDAIAAAAGRVDPSGGVIFIGDVRNYATLHQFHQAIQKFQHPDGTDRVDATAKHAALLDTELCVDPGFFKSLVGKYGIAGVKCLEKRGFHRNELTAFRYDVVLYVCGDNQGASFVTVDAAAAPIVPYTGDHGVATIISDIFAGGDVDGVVLTGIPNARLASSTKNDRSGFDAEYLHKLVLSQNETWLVDVAPVSKMDDDGLDKLVMLVNFKPECGTRLFQSFPGHATDSTTSLVDYGLLANDPLRAQTARALNADLKQLLESALPAYMMPRAIIVMDSIPLTANGKVNRSLLGNHPIPSSARVVKAQEDGTAMEECLPIEGDVQRILRLIWSTLLGVDVQTIFANSNFFSLGGDSMTSLRLVGACRKASYKVSVRQVFENPVLSALANVMVAMQPKPLMATGILENTADDDDERLFSVVSNASNAHKPFDLLPMQRAYWMGQRFLQAALQEDQDRMYSPHVYFEYDVDGALNMSLVEATVDTLVARHPLLRAVVNEDGQMCVLPVDTVRGGWTASIVEGRDAVQKDMMRHGPTTDAFPLFDIRFTTDGPSMRVHISLSLFIMDGRTERILRDEIARVYTELANGNSPVTLPAIGITYRDYAESTVRLPSKEEYKNAKAYWDARLPELPPPPDIPLLDPDAVSRNVTHFGGTLDPPLWSRLKARAASIGTTSTALLCTLYAAALGRFSSRSTFLLNVMHTLRHDVHPDMGKVIGNFSSTILLAVEVHGDLPFTDIVRGVSQRLAKDLDNSIVSGVDIMRAINQARGSAFQAVAPYAFTSTMGMDDGLTGLDAAVKSAVGVRQVYSCVQTPQTWLDHQVEEDEATHELVFNFDFLDGVFPVAVMEGIVATYMRLLNILSGDNHLVWKQPQISLYAQVVPASPVAKPSLLEGLPSHLCDSILAQNPDALAIVDNFGSNLTKTLTYRDVFAASWNVANGLTAAVSGKPLPRVVAVIMHKGWEQVVAVIGCLRAQATYLPIDASWPTKRIQQILEASGAVGIVCTQSSKSAFGDAPSIPRIIVGTPLLRAPTNENIESNDVVQDGIVHGPRDLAYLIYTSWSTGRPKGVCCHHQGAINTNVDLIERFGIGAADRVLGLSSQSFDLSVFDVFGMLGAGGTLVLASERDATTNEPVKVGPDPQRWVEMVQAHEVSIWNTVPAFMELIVNYCEQEHRPLPASLRVVMMSGDWISPTLPSRIHAMSPRSDGIRVISLGGATEAAIWSNMFEVEKGWSPSEHGWSCIPYGRPLRNQTMYVLNDETMEHCEPWVTGVIYIGGAGVALGYFNDPVKTARQFVVHPRTGEYLFRTGDLGRLRPEGELEILGREDSQVKVNGYRIELGELEKVAMEDSRVQNCCALVSDTTGSSQLVVFVTCTQKEGVLESLGAQFRESLPAYMVPRAVVFVDFIPLTSNGKVDRGKLLTQMLPSEMALVPFGEGAVSPIQTRREEILQAIWADILNIPTESIHGGSNFFQLGGDSMNSLQMVGAARHLGWQVSVRQVFDMPILNDLATVLESRVDGTSELVIDGSGGTVIWLHGLGETPENWDDFALRINGALGCRLRWVLPADQNLDWFNNIEASVARIVDIVKREAVNGKRVCIGGFSQGGALAPIVAARCGMPTVNGCISFSGWAMEEELASCKPFDGALFVGHGRLDEQVPCEMSKQLGRFFPAITRIEYAGIGHTSCSKEEQDVVLWLGKLFE